MPKKFSTEKLNDIIKNLTQTMNKSRDEAMKYQQLIIDEAEFITIDLQKIRTKIENVLVQQHQAKQERLALQNQLVAVSRQLSQLPSDELQTLAHQVYEKTDRCVHKFNQTEISFKKLFKEREEKERRLIVLKDQLCETENLIHRISTSFRHLTDDLSEIGVHLDERERAVLKILKAQEQERHRLSRDLHDGLAQTLVHLSMEAEYLKKIVEHEERDLLKQKIQLIDEYLRYAITESRQLIYDLKPMSLDDIGFLQTLQTYISRFSKSKNTNITFTSSDSDQQSGKIDDAVGLVIFRIVQESLNNAIKHAKATEIQVKIEFGPTQTNVRIKDNGVGFDYNTILSNCYSGNHYGLVGMLERAEMIDGTLNIFSETNNGTRILLKIPHHQTHNQAPPKPA